MTTPEQEQELDKGSKAATEEAQLLHGKKANPEVFEQPDADDVVELNPSATVIAKEAAPDPLDPNPDDMVR